MKRYVCIHGHFYQPPRENPLLEEVEVQDTAYPFHDWNERITAECYGPNTASRILDPEKRIIDIVNNYARISFNFGPTLMSWMEKHDPEIYDAIIAADRKSLEQSSGHGSAIAQAYNHIIMPLANERDKRTQVIWGIKDFEHRFQRKPEGMWLPETAVNLETLDIISEHGIKFAILAPGQASRVRKIRSRKWSDVSGAKVDPRIMYLCKLPSGRTINLFFYDGHVSHEVAFAELLNSGEAFAGRLMSTFTDAEEHTPELVHIATDGESYGHHHRNGDMALAYCLYHIESNKLAEITTYGEYLEKELPAYEVEIIENSSWSCVHGIERWRANCGCNSGMHPGWSQEWRVPLREAMDWLRDNLSPLYDREIGSYLRDPWQARDEYISVILDRSRDNIESFFVSQAVRELTKDEKVKILKLLEMQRHAMLMYTSCGWFFDEISGIETVQVMQYAFRAMQLARETSGQDLEPDYREILSRAPSNIPAYQNGARVCELFVKPAIIDLYRVGAHYAVSTVFEDYAETTRISCYTIEREEYDRIEADKQRLVVGRAKLRSDVTWEEKVLSFSVLHFGDHNLSGAVRDYSGEESYFLMQREIKETFNEGDLTEVIRLMDKHFKTHNYSLWHLFRDEQRKVWAEIMNDALEEVEALYRQIYENHYSVLRVMHEFNVPIPGVLASPVEFIMNTDLRRLLESEEIDLERLQKLVEEVKEWGFEPDRTTLNFAATQRTEAFMKKLSEVPEDVDLLESLGSIFRIISVLPLEPDLWKIQNIYFSISKNLYDSMLDRANKSDKNAEVWLEHFRSLADYLKVKVA